MQDTEAKRVEDIGQATNGRPKKRLRKTEVRVAHVLDLIGLPWLICDPGDFNVGEGFRCVPDLGHRASCPPVIGIQCA